jgi:nucleoside 2-deoxyribosyltransferase
MGSRLKIYMAGPDVFLPDPISLAAVKKDIMHKAGFEGLHPFDNVIDSKDSSPEDLSRLIKEANCAMMREADAMIANLTPYHGPSADVGTAYEAGFMDALGKPVFGYMNVTDTFFDRVKAFNGGRLDKDANGDFRDAYGMAAENFGLMENLMIEWAVRPAPDRCWIVCDVPESEIYTSLKAFKMAVQAMQDALLR